MKEDEIRALDAFYPDFPLPREIGWKFKSATGPGFVRNRYVRNAKELAEKIELIGSDLFASVYAVDDDVKEGEAWDRGKAAINRLFFDFDAEDLKAPMREAKKLIESLDVKPLVVFSGRKGFHVHVIFRRVFVDFETVKEAARRVMTNLRLKTCDPAVFEVARLCRVPFTEHSTTGLKCTIIDSEKFLKMTPGEVLKFVKSEKWDFPDYELSSEVAETLETLDAMLWQEKFRPDKDFELEIPVSGDLRKKRIAMYVETLKNTGCLVSNPKIRAIHGKSEWVAKHGNWGALEHMARVYLVLMLIEEGYSDKEIHEIMKFAKDYDPKRTQYYIEYNRRWLAKKSHGSE